MSPENHILIGVTPEGASGAECFVVPGIHAFPPKFIFQVVREGLLHQAVLAVDVGQGHDRISGC